MNLTLLFISWYVFWQESWPDGKTKNAEAELNSKGKLFNQKNANDYQDKVNKGLITRADAAEREKALYQQQQELVALKDNLQSNLVEEEQVMNRQIVEYITSFLEANKADYNYQYILGKSFGECCTLRR